MGPRRPRRSGDGADGLGGEAESPSNGDVDGRRANAKGRGVRAPSPPAGGRNQIQVTESGNDCWRRARQNRDEGKPLDRGRIRS